MGMATLSARPYRHAVLAGLVRPRGCVGVRARAYATAAGTGAGSGTGMRRLSRRVLPA